MQSEHAVLSFDKPFFFIHNESIMAVLDFFKKKSQDDTSDGAVQTPQNPDGQNQTTPSQTVTTQQTETVVGGGTSSYSGIGSPPGGGQAYSGIGSPPGGGQAYSGIGSPPAPSAVSQTTTQTTQANQQPAPVGQANQADSAQQTPDPQGGQNADAGAQKTADTSDTQTPSDGTQKTADEQGKNLDTTGVESNIDQDKRGQLDLMTHLTQRSNRVFVTAQQKAQELGSEYVDSEHLLHGLLADPEVFKIFTENKVQPQIIEQELEKLYKKGENNNPPQAAPRVKRILESALVTARKLGYEFISPEHILLALYEEGEGVGARVLAKLGVKKEDLNKQIVGKKGGLEEGKDGEAKGESIVSQYTNDLTAKAAQGQLDPVVERSDVIERAIHIISRRTKNNPVLVGEAGVGKTAIVEGLAQKIVSKEVPEPLLNKRILQLDLMAILAGASHRGEFEERMKKIIEEITASQGEIILFIDEIHNIVGAGAGGDSSLDASNFLKPSLARGELQMIGATTLTEYRKYIEKDPALERRFQPVMVPEPTVEQTIKMVKALKDKYEAFHRVQIPDETIDAAVKLSKRYVGDRFLPDKAIDIIDEAGSAVRLPLISLPEEIRSHEERLKQLQQELEEAEKRGDKVRANILRPKVEDLQIDLKEKQEEYNSKKSQTTTSVSEQTIKDIIARWTGIPVSKISESETEKLTNLEDIIHKRLINQDPAVEPVAQAVRRGRAGLKSTKRPIGSFVFLGPTGVGKTELSKTLAEILFGQEEAMIRFDMTEYMEKHEVAKLLGAPPGYVGYEEGGKLTEAVRRRPYSVILFDEIEKAHPDIFNILLQILDDGRLTDNKGRTISFKNTVVICTSNIGTKMIQDEILAQGKEEIEEPTVLSTYAYSPRGREIMTIMGKVFMKESQTGSWENMMLIDYFAGQKIEEEVSVKTDEGEETQAKDSTVEFPGKEFDTHVMNPQGVEIISVGDRLYIRTSTTAKVWTTKTLIDYFKDNVVINALPDAPEQQLPTARLKTHAFSPQEQEIVTYSNRFWRRKGGDTNWETGELKDYFTDQTLAQTQNQDLKQSQPVQNTPQSAKTDGADGKPDAGSMTNEQGAKPDSIKTNGQKLQDDALTASQTDTKQGKDSVDTKQTTPSENTQKTPDESKAQKKEPAAFPTNYWDIHGFTPEGGEYIIVGDTMWSRDAQSTVWNVMPLTEHFDKNFPLEKEIEEKEKIENELARNQYNKIKSKVMDELGKFFRPELINRFDEVIIFEPLRYKHMLAIAELQLKAVRELLEEQNIGFAWTDPARKEIVRQGFDPIFGARPLKRTIQKLVENPISTLIIQKKLDESDMVVVDFDGESFIFDIEHVAFVPAHKVKELKKTFKCASGHQFTTVVVPNAVVICPVDGTKTVEEVKETSEQTQPKADAGTENTQDAGITQGTGATQGTGTSQGAGNPQKAPEQKTPPQGANGNGGNGVSPKFKNPSIPPASGKGMSVGESKDDGTTVAGTSSE